MNFKEHVEVEAPAAEAKVETGGEQDES